MAIELLRLALDRIRANALRSALTMLGIVIGIMSVVVLVALAQGASADINEEFADLGANAVTVTAGNEEVGPEEAPLTLADADALRQTPGVATVAPSMQTTTSVVAGDQSQSAAVVATTADYAAAQNLDIARGAFFSAYADETQQRVAVVGSALADDLQIEPDRVSDVEVVVGGMRLQVIGVLAEQGGFGGGGTDDSVLVPLSTVRGRLIEANPDVDSIRVVSSDDDTTELASVVTATLRATHELAEGEVDDFTVMDLSTVVEAASSATATLTLLVAAIASISLIVGGVGVANVMLVSVRERTREIGVRRAIGAHRGDILWQFLLEAVMLGLVGGVVGIGLGVGICAILPLRTVISPAATIAAFLAGGLSSMVAGLAPASQAARVDPATALQYE
jgi:putative ABC transport system permease protein